MKWQRIYQCLVHLVLRNTFCRSILGFALGWNYWFNWVITVAADVTIAAQVIQYWTPMAGIPAWVWSCIFLVIIFALNSLSVRVYGESEYWFALIKVVTVIIFIIIGLLTILGIMGGEFVGFETFTKVTDQF